MVTARQHARKQRRPIDIHRTEKSAIIIDEKPREKIYILKRLKKREYYKIRRSGLEAGEGIAGWCGLSDPDQYV